MMWRCRASNSSHAWSRIRALRFGGPEEGLGRLGSRKRLTKYSCPSRSAKAHMHLPPPALVGSVTIR